MPSHKVFVGGLPKTLSPDTVLGYFEQFGQVTKFVMPKVSSVDETSAISLGFAYISYASAQDANRVLARAHTLSGKRVG